MAEDMEKRISQYIQIRTALEQLEDRHKLERRPLLEIQERLAGILQKFLDDHGTESLKTAAGTCYTTTRYTASVQDPDAFMNFVTSNKLFDLLERRASTTAVRDYVTQNNTLPTGVSLNALSTVGVRRPTGKAKS